MVTKNHAVFKQLKLILWILLFFAVFAGGLWAGYQFFGPNSQRRAEEEATILLERIETVSKLITVEGYFTEIYNYKEWDSYFGGSFFGKKAMVKVKGKVSVGYDMKKVEWTTLPEEKIIRVSGLPEPEILSIDHDLEYYDIEEGYYDYFFNRFSEEDYTRINENAKALIREKAEESELMRTAAEAGLERMDVIRFLVEGAGWTLEVIREPSLKGIRRPVKDSIG